VRTKCIDAITAIELSAATIEIGGAFYKLFKYLKLHPTKFKIPSFLYKVEYVGVWESRSAPSYIGTSGTRVITILKFFKIRKEFHYFEKWHP